MALDFNKGPNIPPSIFLIVGSAGTGLTTALNLFSDFGFVQVADVQPDKWLDIMTTLRKKVPHIAFTLSNTPENVKELEQLISDLPSIKSRVPELNILYLDAPEEILIQRYVDSGRPHPFEAEGNLKQAIREQQTCYSEVKALKGQFPNGYYAIDTSTHTNTELRAKIAKILGINIELTPMTVYIQSFGFKHGLPKESELVFDMRFIKNPYYADELRPLTGLDKPVQDFILAEPSVKEFLTKWPEMIGNLLGHYHTEGKLRLTISIGCTGGQHRSVCLTEILADYLRNKHHGYNIMVAHREKDNWPPSHSSPIPHTDSCQQPIHLS